MLLCAVELLCGVASIRIVLWYSYRYPIDWQIMPQIVLCNSCRMGLVETEE